MPVRIRLRRTGAKKQPSYRVVVADIRSPRDGRFIENLGHYNPRTEPPTIVVNAERALYWLQQGALPSDTVKSLLVKTGVWTQFTGEAPPAKPAAVKEEAPVQEQAAPEPEEPEAPAALEETSEPEEQEPSEESPASEEPEAAEQAAEPEEAEAPEEATESEEQEPPEETDEPEELEQPEEAAQSEESEQPEKTEE